MSNSLRSRVCKLFETASENTRRTSLEQVKLGDRQREVVLALTAAAGPLTAEGIAGALRAMRIDREVVNLRPRINELAGKGVIESKGYSDETRYGKKQTLWALT